MLPYFLSFYTNTTQQQQPPPPPPSTCAINYPLPSHFSKWAHTLTTARAIHQDVNNKPKQPTTQSIPHTTNPMQLHACICVVCTSCRHVLQKYACCYTWRTLVLVPSLTRHNNLGFVLFHTSTYILPRTCTHLAPTCAQWAHTKQPSHKFSPRNICKNTLHL